VSKQKSRHRTSPVKSATIPTVLITVEEWAALGRGRSDQARRPALHGGVANLSLSTGYLGLVKTQGAGRSRPVSSSTGGATPSSAKTKPARNRARRLKQRRWWSG